MRENTRAFFLQLNFQPPDFFCGPRLGPRKKISQESFEMASVQESLEKLAHAFIAFGNVWCCCITLLNNQYRSVK